LNDINGYKINGGINGHIKRNSGSEKRYREYIKTPVLKRIFKRGK